MSQPIWATDTNRPHIHPKRDERPGSFSKHPVLRVHRCGRTNMSEAASIMWPRSRVRCGLRPGGPRDYVVDGHMRGGFALVAFPAKYRNSGVMTFLVNQTGIVYQKDLGPDTSIVAAQLATFDPDATWTTP